MSKKKKKKKYHQHNQNQQPTESYMSPATNIVSGVEPVVTAPIAAPVKQSSPDKLAPVYNAHAGEYRMIRNDLVRVAIVNGIFLVAVLALYYANRTHPFLEAWYTKLSH